MKRLEIPRSKHLVVKVLNATLYFHVAMIVVSYAFLQSEQKWLPGDTKVLYVIVFELHLSLDFIFRIHQQLLCQCTVREDYQF